MLEIWLFSVQSSKENTPNRDRYNAGSFQKKKQQQQQLASAFYAHVARQLLIQIIFPS